MNNIVIEYVWFYSTLSQSLAALIGIIGVFTVYRLQIQENSINDGIENLRLYLYPSRPDACRYLIEKEIMEQTETYIRNMQKSIESNEKQTQELEESHSSKRIDEDNFKRTHQTLSADNENNKKRLLGFQDRKEIVEDRKNWRRKIKISAFTSIVYLTVLFCLSLVGLICSGYFVTNSKWGIYWLIEIFVLLIIGLILLMQCCAVSIIKYDK